VLSSDNVICSLFEGDYHIGVAALINSMVRAEFQGLFWVGYRGELPPWSAVLTRLEQADTFRVTESVTLVFERIDTTYHLTNYKTRFMLSIMDRGIAKKRLCYFDPDIVTQCSWSFYERWLDFGVAMCEEIVNGTMPSDHPLRLSWVESMRSAGWEEPRRQLSRYYNGGFVGVTTNTAGFLQVWDDALHVAVAGGLSLEAFMIGNRERSFYASDQDALNVAAMYFQGDLSTIGPEGMGFNGGGFTMAHANLGTKPWRKRFLVEAMQGKPPLMADRSFLANADGPICPFTAASLRLRRWAMLIAIAVGRVYHRA
jgi:hypothetical protein